MAEQQNGGVNTPTGVPHEDPIVMQMMMDRVRGRVEKQLNGFLGHMEAQMTELVEDIMQEVEKAELPREYRMFDEYKNVDKKRTKAGQLPEKEFMSRNSILTDLMEVNHFKTIYHIFIAILILLFLNTVIYDAVDTGRINLDFELILWNFSKFQTVISIWIGMFCSAVLVYIVFSQWAHNRIAMDPGNKAFLDKSMLIAYIAYIMVFMYVPVLKVLTHDLPPASSAIVLCEQVRLLMKTHAFVRGNYPNVMKYKPHQDSDKDETGPCPDFTKYLYFLFVPTLVYRDNYPRTSRIHWDLVVFNFFQVLGCLFYVYFIMERFLIPSFHHFGEKTFTPKALVLSLFHCMLPGGLALVCSFYCLLHAWMNAFAEMLRFADRMFYKDWWNSTSYANYYRTWNVVVHDWLYTYIFRDLTIVMGSRRSLVPMLVVFAVSALVHEYILIFVFRFCYPVMLVMFGGIGVSFLFLTRFLSSAVGNIFMWLSIIAGQGLMMSLYCMEWYARINCPTVTDPWLDFFLPRSWMCNAVQSMP